MKISIVALNVNGINIGACPSGALNTLLVLIKILSCEEFYFSTPLDSLRWMRFNLQKMKFNPFEVRLNQT